MKTPSIKGTAYLVAIIDEATTLSATFTSEYISELKRKVTPTNVGEFKADTDALQRLCFLAKTELPTQLGARRGEDLELSKEDLLALCEKLIALEITRKNQFGRPLCLFLAGQLWGIEGSPFTEEEGLAWIQEKLVEFGGQEGYTVVVETCDCITCMGGGMTSHLEIANDNARLEDELERQSRGLQIEISSPRGLQRALGAFLN